ncbi:MAG: 3-deoxy-D-manno-octulosonic acid transferase [Alphaproteobacteria bacterium]|nr:3-deoxy-D-manno-octulosonic acid transferase [Alphaproteobacteria bacterium]
MSLYRALTWAATPLAGPLLDHRLARAREDPARLSERLGHASIPRPPGVLLWTHAASVGESLAVLPLLDGLRGAHPAWSLLMTTGTVSAATLLVDRLPAGCFHQFVPLDLPAAAARFLDHWRPDAALWVESELWPNLLAMTRARGVPTALVNGRMSARSFARWRCAPGLARSLVGGFTVALARSEVDAERLRALGAPGARYLGDLKEAAPPLPVDERELAALRRSVAASPIWVAASTHPGEEEICARAHDTLAPCLPLLHTVIVPRHPERGPAIVEALARGGRAVTRRSLGEQPRPGIHVADSLGVLGLYYRVADVALVAGSLLFTGGHNPLEAARLGRPLLFGRHMANFAEAAGRLTACGAAEIVDAETLPAALGRLFDDPALRATRSRAAQDATAHGARVLDRVAAALRPVLDPIG